MLFQLKVIKRKTGMHYRKIRRLNLVSLSIGNWILNKIEKRKLEFDCDKEGRTKTDKRRK